MDNFKNKFIVIMEGKVGNSFGCLFYAHKLAKDTKKDFVINSVKNINREASFYDFFSSKNNFQHIEYSITELNNIVPKHIPFLLHKGHYVNSGAIKDREVIYHRSMDYDELIKTINSFDSVCYLDDASAHAMRNPNEIIESAKNLLIHEENENRYNIQVHKISHQGEEIQEVVHQKISQGESRMGMVKSKYIDHLEQMDQVQEGLMHLQKYGKKSFQNHSGEWVEVSPTVQSNFFDDEVEVIPHEVQCQ